MSIVSLGGAMKPTNPFCQGIVEKDPLLRLISL